MAALAIGICTSEDLFIISRPAIYRFGKVDNDATTRMLEKEGQCFVDRLLIVETGETPEIVDDINTPEKYEEEEE